jgi:glycosyltransferase involved in cell wall biosynthesis
LAEHVELLGAVQGEAMIDLYQRHQLMVLPSAFESYGIVYLEAQQFGLPVIGTTAGAAWEIITNGENGYLIAPEDVQGLAAVLLKLQRERGVLLALSRKALAAFAGHSGWGASCEVIRQFLYTRL